MATVEKKPAYTIIDYKGQKARQYANGAIRDSNGRILKPQPGFVETHAITRDNAHEYIQQREAKKRAAFLAGALGAVDRGDWKANYGDMAVVTAIGETAMLKATTADDPKAIDAGRFVLQELGLAASQLQNSAENDENTSVLAALGAAMVKHITRQAQDSE